MYYVEETQASRALPLISRALSHCMTLGYHQSRPSHTDLDGSQEARTRLFWIVYSLESGLAFRHGRSSALRDADVQLPESPDELHMTRMARIQRKTYDQLYSPSSMAQPDHIRTQIAESLEAEMQKLIAETIQELEVSETHLRECSVFTLTGLTKHTSL